MRRTLVTIFTLAFLCAAGSVGAQSAKACFSLMISADEPTVSSGSEIWLTITMENKSDHDISVYRENTPDQGGFVYKVDVHEDKGTTVPETKFGRRIQGHDTPEERAREPYVTLTSGGEQTLAPGKKMTDRININRLYALSRPGKYIIQVRRFDPENKAFVMSNKIIVTVTP